MTYEDFEKDCITFRGHENILGTHKNTLEITREENVSRRGDCIIGVSADKACFDLSSGLKDRIWQGRRLRLRLIVGKYQQDFFGYGSRDLRLTDRFEIVFRKSDFISDRTGAIRCSISASEVDREAIDLLRDPGTVGQLEIQCVATEPSRLPFGTMWKAVESEIN